MRDSHTGIGLACLFLMQDFRYCPVFLHQPDRAARSIIAPSARLSPVPSCPSIAIHTSWLTALGATLSGHGSGLGIQKMAAKYLRSPGEIEHEAAKLGSRFTAGTLPANEVIQILCALVEELAGRVRRIEAGDAPQP